MTRASVLGCRLQACEEKSLNTQQYVRDERAFPLPIHGTLTKHLQSIDVSDGTTEVTPDWEGISSSLIRGRAKSLEQGMGSAS